MTVKIPANRFFNSELAEITGVENAIFLQDLAYWIDYNMSSDKCRHDGKVWTYSTMDEICNRHKYWTKRQVERIVKNCRENGWIEVGNYNKSSYDRTNWYTLGGKILEFLGIKNDVESIPQDGDIDTDKTVISKSPNGEMENTVQRFGSHQTVTPIPNSIKNIIKEEDETITTQGPRIESPGLPDLLTPIGMVGTTPTLKTNNIQMEAHYRPDWFERFWKYYPYKICKKATMQVWDSIRPDSDLCDIMKDSIDKWKKTKQWKEGIIPSPEKWLRDCRWTDEPPKEYDPDDDRFPDIDPETGLFVGDRSVY